MAQTGESAQIKSYQTFWKRGLEVLKGKDAKEKEAWLQESGKHGEKIEKAYNALPVIPAKRNAGALYKEYTFALGKYISDRRAYIPQRFVGICPCGPGVNIACNFMSTIGLGPCVGVVLYSEKRGQAALVHVDDEFDATGGRPEKTLKQNQAKEKYIDYIKTMMEKMAIQDPQDISVFLVPSTNAQSKELNTIIKNAFTEIGFKDLNDKANDPPTEPESCAVFLSNGTIFRYEERVDFTAKNDSIEKVLNLPKELQLFYLKNGSLVAQDKSAPHEIRDNYVVSKPLDQKVAKEESTHLSTASSSSFSAAVADQLKNDVKTMSDKPIDEQTAVYIPPASAASSSSSSLPPAIPKFPPISPIASRGLSKVGTPSYGYSAAGVQLVFSPLSVREAPINRTPTTASSSTIEGSDLTAGGVDEPKPKRLKMSLSPSTAAATSIAIAAAPPQTLADSFSAATGALTAASRSLVSPNPPTLTLNRKRKYGAFTAQSAPVDGQSLKEKENPLPPSAAAVVINKPHSSPKAK